MFDLNLKSSKGRISYGKFAGAIRYFIDEKKLNATVQNFERVSKTKLTELQKKNFLSENCNEITVARIDGKPDEIRLVKVVINNTFNCDYFRNHLAGFIQSIKNEKLKSVHIFIPPFAPFKKYFETEEYFYQTFAEGLYLGNYEFSKYKSNRSKLKPLEIIFHSENQHKLNKALSYAASLMSAVKFTRDLQNEPGGILTPDELAKRIKSTLTISGIKVKIYNEKEISRRKMGGLLAVGMGSSNSPRFIVLEYNGIKQNSKKNKNINEKIILVGKGVTFDSGGISIKPYQDMWEMKADMSGAAVVAGAILAAAKIKLRKKIWGIIPAAENMLSGSSMRPGDIVLTSSGKSIEVDNTDAEGRMILADALVYASNLKPDVIIDFATLTGACVVALGEYAAGLFSNRDELAKLLVNLGLKTYERVWSLPIWEEYNELNKSDVADLKNVGGKWGGAITAAKFLQQFVDKNIKWAHLDIAGPSMPNSLNNYSKKFMNGFGVRLIFEYLKLF